MVLGEREGRGILGGARKSTYGGQAETHPLDPASNFNPGTLWRCLSCLPPGELETSLQCCSHTHPGFASFTPLPRHSRSQMLSLLRPESWAAALMPSFTLGHRAMTFCRRRTSLRFPQSLMGRDPMRTRAPTFPSEKTELPNGPAVLSLSIRFC